VIVLISSELEHSIVSATCDLAGPDVRICADARELSQRAAAATVATIAAAVTRHGRCSLTFSGGNTPRALYALLASTDPDQIAWRQVHAFWGDERYVPPDDSASNYRMARESLLEQVPLPFQNIHPMPTHLPSPEAAAQDYERTLRAEARHHRPPFDLMFLGMGEDGHTASLFPRSPALRETTRWVVAATVPAQPSTRLTLTLPAIATAARIFVLVSGRAKASALAHVLSPGADPYDYPAAGLPPASGVVTWWVDRDAASGLRKRLP
jgi:6-phosphogluconolactonase